MIEERRGERWDESAPALQTPNSQGTSGLVRILHQLGAKDKPPSLRRHRTSSGDCRHRQNPQPKCTYIEDADQIIREARGLYRLGNSLAPQVTREGMRRKKTGYAKTPLLPHNYGTIYVIIL